VNRAFVVGCIAALFFAALAARQPDPSFAGGPTATPASSAQLPPDQLPAGGVIILAPDPYAWRVWSRGKIEFSFDSGHTWEQQKSGVTTDLIAGNAPTRKVCWIVGKAGTVLLTTDQGRHWKKLTPPSDEDLEGVNAEDGKRASVWTTSHKHSYATNDAGASWAPNEEK